MMSNLEEPSPDMVRRIYFALVKKPRSLEELINMTGVGRATLGGALRFLKEKGMVVRYNFADRATYRMVRTQPLSYGWNLPWLDLMMSKDDWKTPWTYVVYRKTAEDEGEENLNKRFKKLLKDLLVDSNLDLIEVLEELEMTDVSLEVLKLHNQEPYCLECLKKERRFVRMILCEKSEEHCCPNCGVVRETLLVKRH